MFDAEVLITKKEITENINNDINYNILDKIKYNEIISYVKDERYLILIKIIKEISDKNIIKSVRSNSEINKKDIVSYEVFNEIIYVIDEYFNK